MSVQNGLKLIQKLRSDPAFEHKNISMLNDLLPFAAAKDLPCTPEQLESAFLIDWKMRWLKLKNEI